MMMQCMRGNDFREGIRAVLVDKDNSPKWNPSRLEDVSAEQINAYFQPLEEYDLDVFAPTKGTGEVVVAATSPTPSAAATATAEVSTTVPGK